MQKKTQTVKSNLSKSQSENLSLFFLLFQSPKTETVVLLNMIRDFVSQTESSLLTCRAETINLRSPYVKRVQMKHDVFDWC